MSSPDTNQPSQGGAISLELVTASPVTRAEAPSNSGSAPAPALPIKPEPRSGDIAFRMISNFAAENLRQAADALESGMPNLARHHANKALEQIDHIDRL